MSDSRIPDLPSDEELGISGFEEELAREAREKRREQDREDDGGAPPPGPPPPRGAAGSAVTGPARPWLGPLTLLVLLALGWACSPGRTLPRAAPLDAPDPAFSSGRAMLDLVEIAREAHPTGSPEHERVRAFLMERLRSLGLPPEVQTATALLRTGERVRAATVRNVLARLPGTASTGAILLTAHYDGRGISRAAGDDGSGVAAILETLRALQALQPGTPLRNDVLVLFSDAEELGLLGARAFVEGHPWMEDVALALSVEARGGGGPSIMFQTGPENGWVVRALDAGAPRPLANSMGYEVYRRMPNDTDFTPFVEAGVQGLNFAAIGNAHVYHQAYDSPERFDERTLQHQGIQLLGMVRELGGRDLSVVDAPDRVYVSIPLLGLVTWPAVAGWGLALALVVAFGLALLLVLRRGGGWGGMLVGLALALAGVAVGAGMGWGLFEAVKGRHPEWGALRGSAFHVEGWYVGALTAAAVAATTFLLAVARRRFGLGALALGASTLPVVAALVLTFVAPLAAMNLQLPALAMVGGAALVAGVGPRARMGLVPWLLLLPLAAVTLVFVVQVGELVWLSLSLEAGLVVGGLIGLGAVLLLPLLDAFREPGGGWAPALGLALAAAFVGVGLLHARPSAERPAPSTLVYVLDRDAGTALWASRDGPGLGWAGARAGDLGSVQPLEDYLLGEEPWRTGRAPVADVPAPEVLAVVDTTLSGRRSVNLAVRSSSGAELLAFRLPADGDVYLRRVNGLEVPDEPAEARTGASRARLLTHWGTPAGPEGVTLELDAGPGVDSLRLEIVEHHLRPGELVGERFFLRPPALAPDIESLSDRAALRTEVTVATGGPQP
ncbi:MAG: M28 family peptidase [Gemmatimonadetes bacterium]|nr:M28 family peptidase [Gemmatimonadota bacterium]